MTEEATEAGQTGAGTVSCQSAKEMLEKVTRELAEFEAKKLGELKTELDAFVKKQDELVKGYEGSYKALREKWCLQQQQVQQLYSALKCAFPPPSEEWKKIVEECICKKQHDVNCLEKRIARRRRCCSGRLERARDKAKVRFDDAKADLEILKALADKVQADLTADASLIKEINGLMSGPEHAVVLWLFWFQLLPKHKQLAPEDLEEECKKLGDDETPDKLCKEVFCQECTDKEPDACEPPTEEETEDGGSHKRSLPWLMSPKDYRSALDCAWQAYREAKDAWAKAESEYQTTPDDVDSLTKKLDEEKKALEGQIKECLKNAKPDDNCCKKPDDEGCEEQTNA